MRILIVGAGDIGFNLSRRLAREKADIAIIESNTNRATRAREQMDALVVHGHGASIQTLRKAGVERSDLVAALTDNDEVNILACQLAKKSGVKTTIARVRNPEYALPEYKSTARDLGVDHFIHPEKETADTIVRLIRQAGASDVIEFEDGKIQLVGVRLEADSPLLRTPLSMLDERFGNPPVRIIAIHRNQATLIPRGRDEMIPGDQVFGICDPAYVPEFLKLTGKKKINVENVMILGGDLVGQFVARALSGEMNVKLVESNVEKTREIAEMLPNTLIIQGDGTDIDLMAIEGLMDMDAFVAATDDDETNIISTLLARHLHVPRTVALVNKVAYLPITPTIGMDAVVSKQLLTVNAVHQYIQKQEVAAIASVPGIEGYIIEFIVQATDRITRKPLKDCSFPRNAIVGAIMHEERLVIPRGDTHVSAGDRVVVFALPGALDALDRLFIK